MTRNSDWQRVSRRRPCPICGKPDWCLYTGSAEDPSAAICARIESERPAGEGGWLHRLRNEDHRGRSLLRRRVIRAAPDGEGERPIMDFGAYARLCHRSCLPGALRQLADGLGLSHESLVRLQVGSSRRHNAWTFPMSDAAGQVTGIRLRLADGRKLSVRGGREGLFVPVDLEVVDWLLVCEGPTDTAALVDLGFAAVGRPSCSGGARQLTALVARLRPSEVVIVADADEPGRRGAEHLAGVMLPYVPAVRVLFPPDGIKDARAWKLAGASTTDVAAAVEAADVRRLTIKSRLAGGRRP